MTGKERVCPAPPAEPGHGRIAILRSCPVFFSGRLISDSGKRAGKTGAWPVSLTWTDRSILCKKLPKRPAEARGASGGGAGKALRRLAFRDSGGPERHADCDAKSRTEGSYSFRLCPVFGDPFPETRPENQGVGRFPRPGRRAHPVVQKMRRNGPFAAIRAAPLRPLPRREFLCERGEPHACPLPPTPSPGGEGELRSGNAAPKPKNRRNPNALPPSPWGRGRGRGIAGKDPPLPNFALPDFRRGSHPTAAPLVCQGRKKQALAPVSNGRRPRIGPQTADRISRTESGCRAVKPDRPDRAVAASCRPTGAAKGSTFGRFGGARELRRAQFGR